jgi:hypothetical protein
MPGDPDGPATIDDGDDEDSTLPGDGFEEVVDGWEGVETIGDEDSAEPTDTSPLSAVTRVSDRIRDASEVVTNNTILADVDMWRKALEHPETFIPNLDAAEDAIKETPLVQEMLAVENNNLYRALMRLRLPDIPEEQIDTIIKSDHFPRIWRLLVLFEHLFIHRISAIPHLSEEISRHLYEKTRFVGTKTYDGAVLCIDAADSGAMSREDGNRKTLGHIVENIHRPLFATLRFFPEVQYIRTVGDDIICVSEDPEKLQEFAQTVMAEVKAPVHVGVGEGSYSITKTPHGQIVVAGEATKIAEAVQKDPTSRDKVHVKRADNPVENLEPKPIASDMKAPEVSAMRLLRGAPAETVAELAGNSGKLANTLTEYMAMMGCMANLDSMKRLDATEKESISLCIKTPRNSADMETGWQEEVFEWERLILRIAAGYKGQLVHMGINESTNEREAIITFGALGSKSFDQEERFARCLRNLHDTLGTYTMGAEFGNLHISHTSQIETTSDGVIGGERLKNLELKSAGPIRIGPRLLGRLEANGIEIDSSGHFGGMATVKSFGRIYIATCSLDKIKLPSVEDRYVRAEEVTRLLGVAKELLREANGRNVHLDISEEEAHGLGLTRILNEVGRLLGSNEGSGVETVAQLPAYREKGGHYHGVAQVMSLLFPEETDFASWMDKQAIGDEQRKAWTSLFRELKGTTKAELLESSPERAIQIITTIFKEIGRAGVICEDFSNMDATSRDILQNAPIMLITTGSPEEAEHKYGLRGIEIEEALQIARHWLKLDNRDPLPTDSVAGDSLETYLRDNLIRGREGRYNPAAVELTMKALRKANALTNRGGKWQFSSENTKAVSQEPIDELFDGLVREKLEEAGGCGPNAIPLIQIAVLLDLPCTVEELALAASDYYTPSLERDLISCKVFAEKSHVNAPVRFVDPFFAERARGQLSQSSASNGSLVNLEKKLRASVSENGLTVSRYLAVCKNIGRESEPEVIEFLARQIQGISDSKNVAHLREVCEQFMTVLPDDLDRRIDDLSTDAIRQILEIYDSLIVSKLKAGRDVSADLSAFDKLTRAIQLQEDDPTAVDATASITMATADFGDLLGDTTGSLEVNTRGEELYEVDARGLYLRVAAYAAYHKHDIGDLAAQVQATETHYRKREESTITEARSKLAIARLQYRLADQKRQKEKYHKPREKQINAAIEALTEIDRFELGPEADELKREIKTALHAAKAYKASRPHLCKEVKLNPAEHIAETETFLTANEKDHATTNWFLRIKRSLVRPLLPTRGSKVALDCAREVWETAMEHGHIATSLKALCDTLNVLSYRYSAEKDATAIGEAEQLYSIFLQTLEGGAGHLQSAAATHLTRLEWIIAELNSSELQHGPVLTEILIRGDETLAAVESIFGEHGDRLTNMAEEHEQITSSFKKLREEWQVRVA